MYMYMYVCEPLSISQAKEIVFSPHQCAGVVPTVGPCSHGNGHGQYQQSTEFLSPHPPLPRLCPETVGGNPGHHPAGNRLVCMCVCVSLSLPLSLPPSLSLTQSGYPSSYNVVSVSVSVTTARLFHSQWTTVTNLPRFMQTWATLLAAIQLCATSTSEEVGHPHRMD